MEPLYCGGGGFGRLFIFRIAVGELKDSQGQLLKASNIKFIVLKLCHFLALSVSNPYRHSSSRGQFLQHIALFLLAKPSMNALVVVCTLKYRFYLLPLKLNMDPLFVVCRSNTAVTF